MTFNLVIEKGIRKYLQKFTFMTIKILNLCQIYDISIRRINNWLLPEQKIFLKLFCNPGNKTFKCNLVQLLGGE